MKKINRDYFYDEHIISANPLFIEVGLWTIENLTCLNNNHPNSRMLGFEADKDNFKILVKNNNLPNLKVYNKAIGWDNGKAKFYKYKYPAWHSMYPKHHIDNRELVKEVEVDTITIDSVITEPVDLLLLNCEGCEIPVMNSLVNSRKLRKYVRQFCTSFHDRKCYEDGVKKNYLTILKLHYDVYINSDNEVHYYLFIRK